MEQPQNNGVDLTQKIPDWKINSSSVEMPSQLPEEPEESGEEQKRKRRKKGSSRLFEVFNTSEQQNPPLNLTADVSLESRRTLAKNGERYRIEKLLATGGFGQIYLAEDKLLGRKAVIKSLKTEYLDKDRSIRHFITEAKLSSQLEHPAIVPLYSLDTDSTDGLHISMQFIRGITLKEYLTRSRRRIQLYCRSQSRFNKLLRGRLEIFLRICEAMEYCHHRKVLHNDLKPGNIMIANYGQVYVMDWGSATISGSGQTNSAGTPSYMAPEKIATRIPSEKSDIFALGMILNEIVTLRGPVTAESSDEIIARICTGQFEPSSCVLPKYRIAAPLRAIIEKARAAKPQERYSDVRQLADDVRHYLFFEEVKAYPDNLFQKAARFFFHYRIAALSIVLLLLLAAGGASFYNLYQTGLARQRIREKLLSNLQYQTELDQLAMELRRSLIQLQEQMRSMNSTMAIEIQEPSAPAMQARYRMLSDFAPDAPIRVLGMVHTPHYRRPITLHGGTYYRIGNRISEDELQRWGNCFRILHGQLLSALYLSPLAEKTSVRKDRKRLFLQKGGLVRRIIFIVDEGLAFIFPGMYEPIRSVKDFQSGFTQREKRSGQKIIWSPPYKDTSGVSVVACWTTLFDLKGNTLGSLGFEVAAKELFRPIAQQETKKRDIFYALVDPEERMIYEPRSGHQQKFFAVGGKAPDSQVSFRYPHILRTIRSQQTRSSFVTRLNGRNYRIFWTKIPIVEWLLLAIVPE